MGNNGVASQSGSIGTSGINSASTPAASLVAGTSSASFAGTNQWRCDSHAVGQCDVQCLDVDPKDGCPICIPGCSGLSSQSGSGTGNQPLSLSGTGTQSGTSGTSGTGSGSQFGTPASAPFGGQASSAGISQSIGSLTGSGSQLNQAGSVGQNPGTLTGISGQSSQSGGSLGQLPSGLSGTASQGQLPSGPSGTALQGQGQALSGTSASTAAPSCPFYPPNCPKMYTKLENGCLICTLLQQLHLQPFTNTPQVTTASVPLTSIKVKVTCPPTRCIAPCNVGIVLGPNGCPRCKCPSYA